MKTVHSPGSARFLICTVLITVCTLCTAYYRSFAELAYFDDEGAMMLSVKRVLQGEVLYDQVNTIYGPLYYLYQWGAHTLLGIQLSHDSVRVVTICFWVAAALVMFFLVWRATKSLLLSLIAHLLIFSALNFLGEETAHPQEACILLLSALGLACFAQNRTLRMALLGAFAGALAVTKINLGIYVIAALVVGLVFASSPGRLRSLVAVAASSGAVLLPVLVMWGYRDHGWAARYAVLVAFSIAATIVTVARIKWSVPLAMGELAIAVLGFATAVLVICSFPLSHGSSAYAIFDWLVLRPRAVFAEKWFYAAPVRLIAPFWALGGLACAWYLDAIRVRPRAIAIFKLIFAVAVIVLSATGRHGVIFNFATPFLWLIVIHPRRNALDGDRDALARALLALMAVLQSLYAFPVAGSQVSFTNILMIVVAIICLRDGIDWAVTAYPQWFTPRLVRPGFLVVGVLLAALYVGNFLNSRRKYYSFEPLGLPGASRLRIDRKKGQAFRDIVQRVNASCTMLVSEPGFFSFNMWTGKPGPVGFTIGPWIMLVSDGEQQRFVRELSGDPHPCVIYNAYIARLYSHGDVSAKPLVRYIRENFHTVFEAAGYRLMVR